MEVNATDINTYLFVLMLFNGENPEGFINGLSKS
jgi:hypothetical protein